MELEATAHDAQDGSVVDSGSELRDGVALSGTPTPSVADSPATATAGGHRIPPARIRRLIKLDPQVTTVSADAVSLAAIAAELFCEHLAARSSMLAGREKRKTILYKDVSRSVAADKRMDFLTEVVPSPIAFGKAVELQANAEI